VVEIGYPGAVISVNHYRGRTRDGGEYVKSEAREWMDELGWCIKPAHIEDWKRPLSVTCNGMFRNKAAQPDLSNLSKCTLDAIEDVTGVNDREMRWHDGAVIYKADEAPLLRIRIEEAL